MSNIKTEISVDQMDAVCGGVKPGQAGAPVALPFKEGWFEQSRSHGSDVEVRAIRPDGSKTKWRSVGSD